MALLVNDGEYSCKVYNAFGVRYARLSSRISPFTYFAQIRHEIAILADVVESLFNVLPIFHPSKNTVTI